MGVRSINQLVQNMASESTGGTRCFQYMWADAGLSGFETLASLNPMRPGAGGFVFFLGGEKDGISVKIGWLGLVVTLRGRKMMDEDG